MSGVTAENTTSGTKTILFPVALEYTQSQAYDYDSAVATTTSAIDATVEGTTDFSQLFTMRGANEVYMNASKISDAICGEWDAPNGELTAYLDTLLQSQFSAAQLQDDDFVNDETPHLASLDTTTNLAGAVTAADAQDVRKNLFASLVACDASITDVGINAYNFPVEKIQYFEMILRVSLETTLNPIAPAPGVSGTTDSAVSISVANGQQITVTTPVKTIKVKLTNGTGGSPPPSGMPTGPIVPTTIQSAFQAGWPLTLPNSYDITTTVEQGDPGPVEALIYPQVSNSYVRISPISLSYYYQEGVFISMKDADNSYNYAIEVWIDGLIRYHANGEEFASGVWAPGDVFSLGAIGGTIYYEKNGQLVATYPMPAPVFPRFSVDGHGSAHFLLDGGTL